jgi:tryptophan halogenase
MIRRLLILGGGSTGFLVAITVKQRIPELRVTVLRSTDIGIIGVGEGTTVPVLCHLHGYLKIDHADFHRIAQPTWTLRVRFLWGPRPYFDYALSSGGVRVMLPSAEFPAFCEAGPGGFQGKTARGNESQTPPK